MSAALGQDQVSAIEEAYVYAYPLVLLDLIREMVTNVERPRADGAPMNQLFHTRELADPSIVSLTRPNVDTLYSQAYVDLGSEPYLLRKPETDRFCSVQPFDAYSNTPVMLGSGAADGDAAAVYAFTGPTFVGDLPDDVMEVPMPTDLLWLLIRTRCYGPSDLPGARAVQDGLDLYPLSAHGREYKPTLGRYDPASDFVALQRIARMPVAEFFDRFNLLARRNPGAEVDRPALARFRELGIGPELDFDLAALPAPVRARAETLPGLIDMAYAAEHARMTQANGWFTLADTVGRFGTDYPFRAVVALGGFANPVELAVYPSATANATGEPLSGRERYAVRFEAGGLPPTRPGGWWSLTAYDAAGSLIANVIDRYAIGSFDELHPAEDGTMEIVIQCEHPGERREASWLPVCPETFSLTLRIYLPAREVLDGRWRVPAVEMRA